MLLTLGDRNLLWACFHLYLAPTSDVRVNRDRTVAMRYLGKLKVILDQLTDTKYLCHELWIFIPVPIKVKTLHARVSSKYSVEAFAPGCVTAYACRIKLDSFNLAVYLNYHLVWRGRLFKRKLRQGMMLVPISLKKKLLEAVIIYKNKPDVIADVTVCVPRSSNLL